MHPTDADVVEIDNEKLELLMAAAGGRAEIEKPGRPIVATVTTGAPTIQPSVSIRHTEDKWTATAAARSIRQSSNVAETFEIDPRASAAALTPGARDETTGTRPITITARKNGRPQLSWTTRDGGQATVHTPAGARRTEAESQVSDSDREATVTFTLTGQTAGDIIGRLADVATASEHPDSKPMVVFEVDHSPTNDTPTGVRVTAASRRIGVTGRFRSGERNPATAKGENGPTRDTEVGIPAATARAVARAASAAGNDAVRIEIGHGLARLTISKTRPAASLLGVEFTWRAYTLDDLQCSAANRKTVANRFGEDNVCLRGTINGLRDSARTAETACPGMRGHHLVGIDTEAGAITAYTWYEPDEPRLWAPLSGGPPVTDSKAAIKIRGTAWLRLIEAIASIAETNPLAVALGMNVGIHVSREFPHVFAVVLAGSDLEGVDFEGWAIPELK